MNAGFHVKPGSFLFVDNCRFMNVDKIKSFYKQKFFK